MKINPNNGIGNLKNKYPNLNEKIQQYSDFFMVKGRLKW